MADVFIFSKRARLIAAISVLVAALSAAPFVQSARAGPVQSPDPCAGANAAWPYLRNSSDRAQLQSFLADTPAQCAIRQEVQQRLAALSPAPPNRAAPTPQTQSPPVLSASDPHARWTEAMRQANALSDRGDSFDEPQHLREALQVYRDVALPLAPRETRPSDWAATQNAMGVAYEKLSERGDEQARRDSLAAFQAALGVWTRESDSSDWAKAQSNLSAALFGELDQANQAVSAARAAFVARTSENDRAGRETASHSLNDAQVRAHDAGERAVAAARAALTVQTRENDPSGWADSQVNLGNALLGSVLPEISGASLQYYPRLAIQNGIGAYRAALSVDTREAAPRRWATIQGNLSVGLHMLGHGNDDGALNDAVAALRAALTVDTRETAPAAWAHDWTNMCVLLEYLGQGGDGRNHGLDTLNASIVACRAALSVYTPESNPVGWASAQNALAAAQGAYESFQPSDPHGGRRSMRFIGNLQPVARR